MLLLLLQHIHVRGLLLTLKIGIVQGESLGSDAGRRTEPRLLLLRNTTLRERLLLSGIGSWDQISDETI